MNKINDLIKYLKSQPEIKSCDITMDYRSISLSKINNTDLEVLMYEQSTNEKQASQLIEQNFKESFIRELGIKLINIQAKNYHKEDSNFCLNFSYKEDLYE